MRCKDLAGKKYGRLEVKTLDGKSKGGNAIWLCSCDCGRSVKLLSGNIRSGQTKSCGCLQRERPAEAKTTHGLYFSPSGKKSNLYRIWSTMKVRCQNKRNKTYKHYGGRGISVCGEWQDYKAFYDWATANGYKEGLSIERKDNDGNYIAAKSWNELSVFSG